MLIQTSIDPCQPVKIRKKGKHLRDFSEKNNGHPKQTQN